MLELSFYIFYVCKLQDPVLLSNLIYIFSYIIWFYRLPCDIWFVCSCQVEFQRVIRATLELAPASDVELEMLDILARDGRGHSNLILASSVCLVH